MRWSRQVSSREATSRIRALLAQNKLELPIRVVSPIFSTALSADVTPGIEECDDNVWLVEATNELDALHKVERKGARWTCSCAVWAKQRGIDCRHIELVRDFMGGAADGRLYRHARRAALPRIIYDEGKASEFTRRSRARQRIPERVPDLLELLCRLAAASADDVRPRRGRPRVPLAARLYAIGMKSFLRCSYASLACALRNDQRARRLGLPATLSVNSLCNWAADEQMAPVLENIIQRSAAPGRKMDTTLLMDATGRPTTLSGDYLESTYGNAPKARAKSIFLKEHFIRGRRSGLVYGVAFSLSTGTGSADAVHLRVLLEHASDVASNSKMLIADKAYGPIGNCDWCERAGILLVTRAKKHEKRDGNRWPISAREIAAAEKSDPRFKQTYNQRSLVECTPSVTKRRNRASKLRRRRRDKPIDVSIQVARDDEALTLLPQEELRRIVERQRDAVGAARVNEGYTMHIIDNLCTLVTLEELYDAQVSFLSGSFAFEPIRTIWLDDLNTPFRDDPAFTFERDLIARIQSRLSSEKRAGQMGESLRET